MGEEGRVVVLAVAVVGFAAAAVSDLRVRRVSNRLVVALGVWWGVAAVLGIIDREGASLVLAVAGLVVGACAWRVGAWGAGDAKLGAVALAWAGPGGLEIFARVFASGAGLLAAAAMLPLDAMRRMRRSIPLAVPIAAGAVAALVMS